MDVRAVLHFSLCWPAVFMCKVYHMARDAFHSYEQNYTDIAVMEPLVDRLCREVQECQSGLQRAQRAHAKLQGELEMLCDSVESVQWGLINMGGYTNFHTMGPPQRQQMYTTERANLMAVRAMGIQRYLNVIRSQNRGVVRGGDDTDNSEGAESEAPESDPAVDPSDGNLTTVAQTLRNEVNSCLSREAWHEVASFQHALMHLLDTTNQSQQPMPKETRRNLFLSLGNQLQDITDSPIQLSMEGI